MRDWQTFSAALEEWREHPVTEVLREAMRRVVARRKAALLAGYWQGRPASDADRLACLSVEQWCEDFFESDAEDVRAVMESNDEHLGHPPA